MQLIDIGANLTHDSFDDDRRDVIEAASAAGVSPIILTGSTAQGSLDALQLANAWPGKMYATAGVHPHHATEYDDVVHQQLLTLLEDPAVVAVGECGLDYFRNFSPPDAQQTAFARQLELAIETGLPLFLHQRDAFDDFVALIKPRRAQLGRAVAHCFTGNEAELDAFIEMDLYIGITGWICDERRGQHLQEIVSRIPADRIMIETDAPYLLPRTLRPKPKSRRNVPGHLPEVLRVLAECMGYETAELAALTTANAMRFFELTEVQQ